ncbi:hypothetical protein [Falsiroseomonas oryzae]|uniref:hypothetical protein n=1 Tax=Falsiroseomonas oryzae TaxID=2766473 RepID=UPI0022EA371A|nr:hypothetical protein [Roseomonas sp. MO-31]
MTRGAEVEAFAAKLRLAMRRGNLSSVQLAQGVGVDKSVVTRWLSGALRPADHSLATLSALLARHVAGFCRDDWDLAEAAFAARLGVALPRPAAASPPLHEILAPLLHGAAADHAATAYPGLWASLFGSMRGRGRLFGYAGRIQAVPGCPALRFDVGDSELFFAPGALIAFGPRLYGMRQVAGRPDSIALSVLTGVATGRAVILDGFAVTRDSGPEGAAAAAPVLHFRLSHSLDDALFDAARRRAGELNLEGWEAHLPQPLLDHFRPHLLPPPAPAVLRRPMAESWATQTEDLHDPVLANRREALEAVHALFAPVLQPA